MDSPKYTTPTVLQVYASKKGWKTGSGTPAEMAAAKHIMKDYTTGRLLHVQLRPDYDIAQHGELDQNGYNLDMSVLDQQQASAQNYEELRSNASTMMSQTVQIEEEETKVPLGDNLQKLSNAQQKQLFSKAEDDFDMQFFKGNASKVKLNKGEKRALKFAVQQGEDLSQVGDLKSYLANKMKDNKAHNSRVMASVKAEKKPQFNSKKFNDYKQLEDYTSD